MRLLLLLSILCLLVAASADSAAATLERTTGGVYLEFQRGAGVAKVRFRGNFFGRVVQGRIVATRNVNLNGCESREQVNETLVACSGDDLTFRTLVGTRWRLRLNGRGIGATGFVRGCMTLNARDSGSTGVFKIGSNGALRAWPREAQSFKLGLGC
ncbi:MAG: hypothetical protein ABI649_06710 [Gaiellaceae bacterium]